MIGRPAYRAVWGLCLFLFVEALLPADALGQSEEGGSAEVPSGTPSPAPPAPAPAVEDHRDAGEPHRRHRRRRHRRRRPRSEDSAREERDEAGTPHRRRRRRRRRRRPRRRRRHRRRRPRAPVAAEPAFEGPRFEAGWRYYSMVDFHDEGAVHAIDFTIFPVRGALRMGASVEAALRSDASDPDILLRAYGSLGYQSPGRVTPFVVATLGLGTIAQKRFHITEWSVLGTIGLEAGAEVRLGAAFRLSGALGVQRVLTTGVRYDGLTLRLGMGF